MSTHLGLFYLKMLRNCVHCTFIFTFLCCCLRVFYRPIGLMSRMFTNGDWSSIPGRVIPKTQKMVLNAILFSTQHYKVRTKGKVEQSWEWSSASLHLDVVAIEKGAFGSPSTKVTNFTLLYLQTIIWFQVTKDNNP